MNNHSVKTLNIDAPAKLNLYLKVVGRRADGYHLLQTLMVKLSLADQVELTLGGAGIRLDVRGSDLSAGSDNLAVRAAKSFFREIGETPAVHIVLCKNIPLSAGLGGGSSDAAAVLSGLNELYDRPVDEPRLAEIGLILGADVPFFLFPGSSAWAEGVGERLQAGPDLSGNYFLLVYPGFGISTSEVYKKYKLELTSTHPSHIFSGLNERSFTIGPDLHNDLEMVVLPEKPELGRIKALLRSAGAIGALMSGSGATVFGAFSTKRDMEHARVRLEKEGRGIWMVVPTRAL
jgi:4-diphosphocytidyl-2-C-methyl-D-erythritol kinase